MFSYLYRKAVGVSRKGFYIPVLVRGIFTLSFPHLLFAQPQIPVVNNTVPATTVSSAQIPVINKAAPASTMLNAPNQVLKTKDAKPKTPDTTHIGKRLQNTFSRFSPFYVFIFLGGFVMLAVIRILDPPYLKNLLASVINLKLLISLFNEGIFGFNVTNLLLDVLCICMLSIGIQIYFFAGQPGYFLWILAFTCTGYFLKLIIIQFLANIFMGREEALSHLLMHLLLTRLLGLVLLPVLFAGLYQTVVDVNILLHIIFVIIFLLYLGWLARLFLQIKSISASGAFYLFVYLCTIELSPLAILLKDYIR